MTIKKNNNSLLFLYEGETEAEFYHRIIDLYVPPRKIRINYSNLKGVYSITEKVCSKIELYLHNEASFSCNKINVFVAYDRDGPRETETRLDIKSLKQMYLNKGSRISSINEIVATQDLESWFFHDIEGIYNYLKAPKNKRAKTFNNVEATNWRVLSDLFHRFNMHYQKGKKASGFLVHLNIDKICSNVQELKDAVTFINQLCSSKKPRKSHWK